MHRKAGYAVTARIRPMEIALGPVPSRRLGQSLGVDNVPAKTTGYSNVYCRLGPALATEATRRAFLAKAGADRTLVTWLLDADHLGQTEHGGRRFFVRRHPAGHQKSDEAASP